ADWITSFNDNIASQRWFVMPLFQPHFLNKVQKMRILDEPKKIFGGPDEAWMLAHKDLRKNLSKHAWGALQRMSLSIKAVTELDYLVNVRNVPPRDAARHWMASHADTVGYWLQGESE
ncbi:MAG: glycine betaine ABC transporter substrate-binding protein, partial [Burkholderiales bacterium]